ncbi:CGI-12 PROTEIN-RELATED [Salix purpurea]|uniref:CGI-12 PROTEIN-RELATED n=1 Tax=Salix purpurea TaxID=77065 RepID=A0A9Q0WIG5_SALPP|nr:CGI-12 PROTEIN-RELATED [Salix purpurea]
MWALSEISLQASKQVHFETPDEPGSALAVFKNYGFSKSHVLNLVRRLPTYSLQNQLVPAFDFLETSLQSDAEAIKAVKRFPLVLNVTVETMARVVDVLRDNGVPGKNIALLIRSRPSVMVSNLENLKKLREEATLMGFHPSKTQFVEAVRVSTAMNSLCCTHLYHQPLA